MSAKGKGRKRLRRPHLKPVPRVVVPSFFTLMNLFCGFLAIINISEGKLEIGALLIVIAGLFDALDGFMARLSNAESDFGVELDSLSDIVSFGVAPGILIWQFALKDMQFVGITMAALPALCGAVRLARYNVEAHDGESSDEYFSGLPIPAQAMMITALFLALKENMHWFENFKYGISGFLIPTVVTLSFLMVTKVPFDKTPRFSKKYMAHNRYKILLFITYLILIIVFQEFGLIAVFTFFIAKGLYLAAKRFYQALEIDEEEEDEENKQIDINDTTNDYEDDSDR